MLTHAEYVDHLLHNFAPPLLPSFLPMFRVTRQIDFCYGHRLLNYDGKCKYLHGHNGRAIITLEGEKLDERGMVLDFTDIKRVVSHWIDTNLDHRMLLHREDPLVSVLLEHGEPLYLMDENPTAENIAKLIYDITEKSGFPILECHLWETPELETHLADRHLAREVGSRRRG